MRSVGHEQWGGRLGKTSEVEEQAGGETRERGGGVEWVVERKHAQMRDWLDSVT